MEHKKKKIKAVDKNKKKSVKNVNRKVKDTYKLGNICLVLTIVVTIFVALTSYKLYEEFNNVPELPKYDLNFSWAINNESQDTSIRRFKITFTDAMQQQLTRKFDYYRDTKKTKSFEDTAWKYGINSEALAQVMAHWQFNYNFRERQRYLNKFEHFKTNIQGLDIHFVHVKPKEDDVPVLPILLLHGWPGSFREFYNIIPQLIARRPGYNFVFEVIVPSLPGFIYSQAPAKKGFNTVQAAIIMRNLMQRIGFKQYYIQGGDFGHSIGSHMATLFPNEVLGFHTNFPINFSKLANLCWIFGAIWPTFVEKNYANRMYPLSDKLNFLIEESGYIHLQGTKPDTIGIALQDSPLGLAAYILDRYMIFTNPNNKLLLDGGLSNYNLTDLIDNIMLYWVTGSITSSLRFYKETIMNTEEEQILAKIPTSVPTWGLRLKHELLFQPEFLIRWKYLNLIGTAELDEGGHFAAFEKPEILATDIFKAVDEFIKHKVHV